MSNRIALTAWTHLDSFDDFDESRIVEFIEYYRNKGPEAFPDSDADILIDVSGGPALVSAPDLRQRRVSAICSAMR